MTRRRQLQHVLTGVLLLTPFAVRGDARPALLSTRYDEDWRPYCAATPTPTKLESIKCIHLPGPALLSLGGELRERAEVVENPGFGLKHSHDHAFLHRALVFSDLRLGESLRTFVQFNYANESDRPFSPAATDIDKLDLAQGFLEVGLPVDGDELSLRGGRQELSFGSQRLISVRDSPNVRRNFDGARVMWKDQGYRIDALYARPVRISRSAFDDKTSTSESLAGLYATLPLATGKAANIDVYFLDYRRNEARFSLGIADERRHTIGTRLFGSVRQLDWNIESVYQFGRFGQRDVDAWTLASDVGYTFGHTDFNPRLGVKLDIASGTRHPGHGSLGTFNALYPKLPYFSDANLIAPANIVDLHPSLRVAATTSIIVELGWDLIWRETIHDAVYAPPLVPIAGTAGRGSRFTGHQFIAEARWKLSRFLSVSTQLVHFESARAIRLAQGRNVNFAFSAISFMF